MSDVRDPQVLFGDEDLEQALRQLVLYGHDGLPVLSHDEHTLQGWVTREDVMRALIGRVQASAREIERGAEAAEFAVKEPHKQVHVPSTPLDGYEILEITISPQTPACGRRLGEMRWPAGSSVLGGQRRTQTHRTPRRHRAAPRRANRTARPRRSLTGRYAAGNRRVAALSPRRPPPSIRVPAIKLTARARVPRCVSRCQSRSK